MGCERFSGWDVMSARWTRKGVFSNGPFQPLALSAGRRLNFGPVLDEAEMARRAELALLGLLEAAGAVFRAAMGVWGCPKSLAPQPTADLELF